MTESEKDDLRAVGYDEETIAAVDAELDASPCQSGVVRMRFKRSPPAVTLFEQTR